MNQKYSPIDRVCNTMCVCVLNVYGKWSNAHCILYTLTLWRAIRYGTVKAIINDKLQKCIKFKLNLKKKKQQRIEKFNWRTTTLSNKQSALLYASWTKWFYVCCNSLLLLRFSTAVFVIYSFFFIYNAMFLYYKICVE